MLSLGLSLTSVAVRGALAAPSFEVDFRRTGSIVPTRGSATVTTSRASIATVTDHEGVVRYALANECRMHGQRRVQNLCPAPTDVLTVGNNKTVTLTQSATLVFSMGPGSGVATFSGTGGATGTLTANASNRTAVTKVVTAGTFIVTGSVASLTDLLIEDVTGRSNQNPSEYVSVGLLSAPFHGANVDGVKYFPWLNGNTVAATVVTQAQGALISTNINRGYLPEPVATQILTLTDVRDMTTANWVLGATMTRARTSVGADGVANRATRLTGGATTATNTILLTVTAAASSRTYSALIKRVTGTGAISITQNGGTTWTNIASQINTSTFTKVALNASVLNASIGIQITTNGDAVDVDFNQFVAGDVAGQIDSRIPDSIATRAVDVPPSYASTNWLTAGQGTLVAEALNPAGSGVYVFASLNDGTAANRVVLYSTVTTNAFANVQVAAAVQANLANTPLTGNATAKIAIAYKANDFAAFANNVSLGTSATGTVPTVTRLEIGADAGVFVFGNPIARVGYYPNRTPNFDLQRLTV